MISTSKNGFTPFDGSKYKHRFIILDGAEFLVISRYKNKRRAKSGENFFGSSSGPDAE